jgi:hypothetical protein
LDASSSDSSEISAYESVIGVKGMHFTKGLEEFDLATIF